MIKRQYFLCKDDSDYSDTVNRWIDNDGMLMKWACKIMDQASKEESKKLVPYEKPMFYFFIGDRKILISYENTGKLQRYVVNYKVLGTDMVTFDKFYDLLYYLYTDQVEVDLEYFFNFVYSPIE